MFVTVTEKVTTSPAAATLVRAAPFTPTIAVTDLFNDKAGAATTSPDVVPSAGTADPPVKGSGVAVLSVAPGITSPLVVVVVTVSVVVASADVCAEASVVAASAGVVV